MAGLRSQGAPALGARAWQAVARGEVRSRLGRTARHGAASAYSLGFAVVFAVSDGEVSLPVGTVVLAYALMVSVPVGALAGSVLGLGLLALVRARSSWVGPALLALVLLALFAVVGSQLGGDTFALVAFGLAPGACAAAALLWHAADLRRRI